LRWGKGEIGWPRAKRSLDVSCFISYTERPWADFVLAFFYTFSKDIKINEEYLFSAVEYRIFLIKTLKIGVPRKSGLQNLHFVPGRREVQNVHTKYLEREVHRIYTLYLEGEEYRLYTRRT
jgi:hypothetical protein